MTDDPTAPLTERTPEQVSEFVDNHLIMALTGADRLHPEDRDEAEDYVRNRLVAMSDSWPTVEALTAEDRRRRMGRISRALGSRS